MAGQGMGIGYQQCTSTVDGHGIGYRLCTSTAVRLVLFSSKKIFTKFFNFPSYRIFRHMHEALNIDKK
jgi:hypothetical protein